jgi:hypothetical protein
MSAPPLRVMLVDDHQIVRDGIKLLLTDTPDVVVCAEAASTREAVAVAARPCPTSSSWTSGSPTARGSRPPATSAPPAPTPAC